MGQQIKKAQTQLTPSRRRREEEEMRQGDREGDECEEKRERRGMSGEEKRSFTALVRFWYQIKTGDMIMKTHGLIHVRHDVCR